MSTPRSKFGLLGRINWEDLYNAFLGLEERQQILVAVGGALLLLVLIVLPISCASSRLGKLEAEYEGSREGQSTFSSKIAQYQSAKEKLDLLRKKMGSATGGGSLTSLLESAANEAGLEGRIERLKPITLGSGDFYDEEGVDGVVSGATLPQIVDFLYRLETHQEMPVKIKKLQIKPRYGRREEMTVSFQVSTIRLKGEEGE